MMQAKTDTLRTLPQNADAERAVLSCALQWPDECIDSIATRPGGSKLFYSPAHRKVWEAIQTVHESEQQLDFVTLTTHLTEAGTIESAGGPHGIAEFLDDVPSKSLLDDYLSSLERAYRRRASIRSLTDSLSRLWDSSPENETETVLSDTQNTLSSLLEDGSDGSHLRTMKEVTLSAINELEAKVHGTEAIPGTATGFPDLDDATNGFPAGKMIIVAARPGKGKSALGFQFALNMAKDGNPTAVFSLEMYGEELANRALSSRSGVDGLELARGDIGKNDFRHILKATQSVAELPIWIDDSPNMGLKHIEATTRKLVREHGVKVVVVDYLGHIKEPDGSRSRVDAVSKLSNGLTRLAKETGVAMIVLSQINRKSDDRGSGKPILSDLRDSGEIEQDAFGVLLLHHKEPRESDDEDASAAECIVDVDIIVAKWRGGRVGPVPVTFLKPTTTFESKPQSTR